MKKVLVRILCLACVLMVATATMTAASAATNVYRYVKTGNGGDLNVRSNPYKTNNNTIAKIPYRSYVLVLSYDDTKTWAYIETDNPNAAGTIKGWVAKSYLVKNDPGPYKGGDTTVTFEQINAAAKAMKVLDVPYNTVIQTKKATNYVHLRWFPSTSAAYSGAYLCDTEIQVLAESNTWAQVRIVEDGKVGFILKSCVTPVY